MDRRKFLGRVMTAMAGTTVGISGVRVGFPMVDFRERGPDGGLWGERILLRDLCDGIGSNAAPAERRGPDLRELCRYQSCYRI